jgi:hypothetical protein
VSRKQNRKEEKFKKRRKNWNSVRVINENKIKIKGDNTNPEVFKIEKKEIIANAKDKRDRVINGLKEKQREGNK